MDISRTALVPFSPDQMYRLVEDVNAYPEFLSWCTGATVLEQGETTQLASLDIAAAGIRKQFTTRNTLTPGRRLDMHLVDGPFRKLNGAWLFEALGDAGCKVTLTMSFETMGLFGGAFGRGFAHVADRLVADFTRRAEAVYR
ncbi:type II toxin-antitoxin system RatA family toxin [Marinihelvus fidelis]|uniref:Type II toxin-antitoxin system RatA family toxin n=1 Tax=Marinihelvus fidelis TaxID=2613842 RepID=A0A5N0TFH6_9GAMM|nr:type II toxin-antitoxin system RatA family toxin [Marinihelvus fidelis]KAA9133224.1 type II toxin-antitoxin system RatA family toxin [Marinihelvus fidelis]